MKISVIFVHFNAQKLLENAIFSFWKQKTDVEWEFLVTDNSQNFQTKELAKVGISVHVFDLGYNAGFARGVNQGLKNASGDVIMIVNQDAYLCDHSSISKIVSELQSLPQKTILGCCLVDEENQFQQSVWLDDPGLMREWKRGALNCKINPNWQTKSEDIKLEIHKRSGFVHRINGAFLVFRRPKNDKEVLFDEDFFLYGEDIEWALRMKRIGWRFYHFADVKLNHIGSASSTNEATKLAQIEIMDWLVLRKVKGRLYLSFYIKLLTYNRWLDHKLAKRTGSKFLIDQTNKRRLKLRELKNTYFDIIQRNNSQELFSRLNLYI